MFPFHLLFNRLSLTVALQIDHRGAGRFLQDEFLQAIQVYVGPPAGGYGAYELRKWQHPGQYFTSAGDYATRQVQRLCFHLCTWLVA